MYYSKEKVITMIRIIYQNRITTNLNPLVYKVYRSKKKQLF